MPTFAKIRVPNVTRSKGARIASLGADAVTMIVGLGACETVKLIGTIPGSEVILVPLVPILLVVGWKKFAQGRLKFLFLLLGLWLLGQMLTDLYRGTAFLDWIKGDSAIVFLALDLAGFAALLSGNERRKTIFIFSFALGSLLATRISPDYFFASDPWKFGYGLPVTALVVLVSCWFFARRRYTVVALLLLGIAGANLLNNFRSPVLSIFVTIGLTVPAIPERIGRLRILPPRGTGLRIVVLVVMVMVMGGIAKVVTTGLAASGALGEEARQKNEKEANSTLGVLLGGRPEVFVSARAVFDSPILGHGSYARDLKYLEMYDDLRVETGITETEDPYHWEKAAAEGEVIPSHSELMQAWVFAGVLGALFWGYVFVLLIRSIIRTTVLQPALTPVYAYLFISFAWDILFTPFVSGDRVLQAFLLVSICDLLNSAPAATWRPFSGMWRRRLFRPPVRRRTWKYTHN